jgi:hypothetical protein
MAIRIHHMGDLVVVYQVGHRLRRRRVHPGRRKPNIGNGFRGSLRTSLVVVADHHTVEEVPPRRDRAERRSHSPGADQKNPHG